MNQIFRPLSRFIRSAQPLKPFPPKLVNSVKSSLKALAAKPVIYGSIALSFGVAGVGLWSLYTRYGPRHTLVLVAGNDTGESYKLSNALAAVVEKHRCRLQNLPSNVLTGKVCLNFRLEVIRTQGTEENLYALQEQPEPGQVQEETKQAIRDKGAKYAHLATAQADIVADRIGQPATSSARNVAVLFTDTFQLIVRKSLAPAALHPGASTKTGNGSQETDQPKFLFSKLKGETIEVPRLGGQRESLRAIAVHNGLTRINPDGSVFREQDGSIGIALNLAEESTPESRSAAICSGQIDGMFRVRVLGNSDIQAVLECENGGEPGVLVPIDQAAAMRIKHPAFYDNATIPKGAYGGGDVPNPPRDIQTIAVKRLLLAREDVPAQIIRDLTQVLNEYKPDLAEKISEQALRPLVTQINEPGAGESGTTDRAGVALHEGARRFYKRDEPPFYIKHLGLFSTVLTVILGTITLLIHLNQRIERESKDKADAYIDTVVKLMRKDQSLEALTTAQSKIEDVFQKASKALEQDKISQESFRTFNEAYKTAREYIERAIEAIQRQESEKYIAKVMYLLDDQRIEPHEQLKQLDIILIDAKEALTRHKVFSRESFRTFIEAHNLVRETLERRQNVLT